MPRSRNGHIAASCNLSRGAPEIDHPWVDELRQRAERLSFRALELITRAHPELGHYAMAEADADRLIEASHFDETGYEVLMAVHIARGSPARAIQVYEKYSAFLTKELGTSPGPAVREIFGKAAQLSGQGAGS